MNHRVLATGVAIASSLLPMQAIAADFSALYVFGDSLSDTGNIFGFSEALLGTGQPQPPYFEGRISNGPVWIDYLAKELELEPTPLADILFQGSTPTEGTSFAFVGATTGLENTVLPLLPGLQTQVGLFTQSLGGGQADPDALYIVWGGANDYLPTQSTTFTPYTTPEPVVSNLVSSITALATLGARNFLVPNLPDLGQVPLVVNTPLSGFLDDLSASHNALLATEVAHLGDLLPGLNLTLLDVNSVFDAALAGGFGFTTVDTPCLIAGIPCSSPENSLFWDFIHPTTPAHKQIGVLAYNALDPAAPRSVPEPLSVLGMIVGGSLGVRLTRRAS